MKYKTAHSKLPQQSVKFPDQGMTEQSHKQECDINQIMAKYQRTGIIEHARQDIPQYGDAPSEDYQQSLNVIIEAENHFKSLPSSIRKRFEHNPQKYLEFLEDPKNKEEMQKMGLLKPSKIPPENQIEIRQRRKEDKTTNTEPPEKKSS